MHWTQLIEVAAIALGVVCLAVASNLSAKLKFNWMTKTLTGQMLYLFAIIGFFLVLLYVMGLNGY